MKMGELVLLVVWTRKSLLYLGDACMVMIFVDVKLGYVEGSLKDFFNVLFFTKNST